MNEKIPPNRRLRFVRKNSLKNFCVRYFDTFVYSFVHLHREQFTYIRIYICIRIHIRITLTRSITMLMEPIERKWRHSVRNLWFILLMYKYRWIIIELNINSSPQFTVQIICKLNELQRNGIVHLSEPQQHAECRWCSSIQIVAFFFFTMYVSAIWMGWLSAVHSLLALNVQYARNM